MDNGYSLHLLDAFARPALLHSPSAPDPRQRTFTGPAGLQDIADGLAALGLESRPPERVRTPDSGAAEGPGRQGRRGRRPSAGRAANRRDGRPGPSGDRASGADQPEGGGRAFGDALLDSLAQRRRGPLLAVLGRLSAGEAQRLAPAAEYASRACAVLVVNRLADAAPALAVLRAGGWDAAAATPESDLARIWASFGAPAVLPAAASITREDRP
ncbi:hypothetical protein OL239_15150 [Arthrobacter sp. ATA002]|uniref:hypothetical protein n=1 Tax=Arthrobacter sp. ATA002 TaxID=2991715 RepID=UPI0022A765D5|nr:hypothetical protein [Arthrobacter sp. ATA002]WAP51191.1 hypothetical protein OL239_15150 [Arthrobacter sp. ATA002]